MHDDKSIMKHEAVLPEDFDGVFRFTNWSDTDFIGVWGSKQYRFPAVSTSPMIIPDHSPVEIQHIRRKFARDLAEREYFKSQQYEQIRAIEGERDAKTGLILNPRLNSSLNANSYSLSELTSFIQRCLEPLPIQKAEVKQAPKPKDVESALTRNDEGELNTEAIARNVSLKEKALGNNNR